MANSPLAAYARSLSLPLPLTCGSASPPRRARTSFRR